MPVMFPPDEAADLQAAREADRGTRAGREIAASCAASITARRNP